MAEQKKQYSVGYRYDSDLNLIALKGSGIHYIDSHDYHWDNRARQDDFCLLQYSIAGQGELEYQGIHYTLNPGDLFLVDIPSESHYFLPENSDYWEVCYLEFSKECLPLLHKVHGQAGVVIHLGEDSKTAKEILSIYQKAYFQEIESYFENTKLAYCFWIDFLTEVQEKSRKKLSKVDFIKKYIDQNYSNPDISLDLLAENFGISKYYMCKEFKKSYGISIGKYIQDIRMEHACQLLLSNDEIPIDRIAERSGYVGSNYFGKVFKRRYGISPDLYRKQNAKYDQVLRLYETSKMNNT